VTDLALLDALNTGANMVTSIASTLGIPFAEAERQLGAATAGGLVIWQDDDHHFTDADVDRRFAHLSTAGLKELHRLHQAAAEE
jgi:DNA-binding IclR family transcriptional regulator